MDGNCRPLHKPISCNNAVLDTELPPTMSKSARKTRKGGTSAAERHAQTDYNTSLRLWKKRSRSSLSSSTASSSFSDRHKSTVQARHSQAKHKTYALSRQLSQQGIFLTDELTPKQQQAQNALDPGRIALRSKGFRTWFGHGTLWYLDQGVPRECKQGEAVRLPPTQGSPPRPNMPAARAPPRGPSGRPRRTPDRSGGSAPAGTPRANRVVAPIPASCQPPPYPASPAASPPSPSYAFVAGSDPVAAMDTGPARSFWSSCRSCRCTCSCILHPYSCPSGQPSFFTSWALCSHKPPIGGCQPTTTATACLHTSMEHSWAS